MGVIGYIDVYKISLPNDHFGLLRAYPTDLIICYLSKINAVLFQEKNTQEQAVKIFRHVFIKQEQLNYEDIVAKLFNHEHQVLFAAPSISYLIKTSLAYFKPAVETEEIDIKAFQKHLFDTILIYNNVTYEISNIELESLQGIWEITIRQQQYIRDFNALFYTVPTKFILIQRYFNKTKEGQDILERFQKQMGLSNFWSFAKIFLDLIRMMLSNGQTGQYILSQDKVSAQVLKNFCFPKGECKNEISIHMDIIPKPFYELDDEYIAVIDFNYFRYVLDQGIFWCIFQHSSHCDNFPYKNFNAFSTKIGHDYFEQFLVGSLLRTLFNGKYQTVISDSVFEDFWIKLNNKELILVEVKMADIHPLSIEAFDVDKFENFIVSNYAKEKDYAGAKGVYQLIRQLDILQNFGLRVQQKLKLKSLKNLIVYPVIIYSDQILDSAGVNAFIQSKFESKIQTTSTYEFSIKPITMVGINTILEHLKFFKKSTNSFVQKLSAYHKYIKGKRKDYTRFSGPFIFYQQNISFAEYMNKKEGQSENAAKENLAILRNMIEGGAFDGDTTV